jgi:hypothetical protein
MFLGIASVFFAVYFLNVFSSAYGWGTYLTEVSELIVLVISVLFFVAGILKREAAAKKSNEKTN